MIRGINSPTNEETLSIRAVEVTTSTVGDAPMLPELLAQIDPNQKIATVTADGAYDTRKCHDAIADRGAQVAEVQIRAAVLNRFTALGIPVTMVAG